MYGGVDYCKRYARAIPRSKALSGGASGLRVRATRRTILVQCTAQRFAVVRNAPLRSAAIGANGLHSASVPRGCAWTGTEPPVTSATSGQNSKKLQESGFEVGQHKPSMP
jgi:hypothetical protein